jgi:hypothetical protein
LIHKTNTKKRNLSVSSDLYVEFFFKSSIAFVNNYMFLNLSDSYFLFVDLVGFLYTLNIYAHFSSHFSQQLLMAEIWYFVTSFMKLVTKYQISAINSYWEKCDETYLGRTEGRTEVKQYTPLPLRGAGV